MNAKAILCRSLIDTSLGTCCVLVRSKSEHGIWKLIGKQKEAMKKRHKMCRFEFLEPKNEIHNNQPQTRVGKPFAVVAACWKWVSIVIYASKKDRQLSLAFLRDRRRRWQKMSGSPMGKLGYSREVFDCLPVGYVVSVTGTAPKHLHNKHVVSIGMLHALHMHAFTWHLHLK